MVQNPFKLLKEVVDPFLAAVPVDQLPKVDPLLALLGDEEVKGIQVPESGILEIFLFYADPAIFIGDRWEYQASQPNLAQGQVKFKKFTAQVTLTEDQLDRIKQNGMNSLVQSQVIAQQRGDVAYLTAQISKWMIDPWQGVTTDADYDSLWRGCFAGSSDGNLTNPSDLNAVAGTALDLSAVNFSGTNQSANVVATLLAGIKPGMVKIDFNTDRVLPITQIYLGVHPYVKSVFDSSRDILNTTTGERSTRFISEDLAAVGITVIENVRFDADYTYTTTTTSVVTAFADPQTDFKMLNVPPPEGVGWSAWEGTTIPANEGRTRKVFEKHKKLELAAFIQGYVVATAVATISVYKKVFRVTITPFENT